MSQRDEQSKLKAMLLIGVIASAVFSCIELVLFRHAHYFADILGGGLYDVVTLALFLQAALTALIVYLILMKEEQFRKEVECSYDHTASAWWRTLRRLTPHPGCCMDVGLFAGALSALITHCLAMSLYLFASKAYVIGILAGIAVGIMGFVLFHAFFFLAVLGLYGLSNSAGKLLRRNTLLED